MFTELHMLCAVPEAFTWWALITTSLSIIFSLPHLLSIYPTAVPGEPSPTVLTPMLAVDAHVEGSTGEDAPRSRPLVGIFTLLLFMHTLFVQQSYIRAWLDYEEVGTPREIAMGSPDI